MFYYTNPDGDGFRIYMRRSVCTSSLLLKNIKHVNMKSLIFQKGDLVLITDGITDVLLPLNEEIGIVRINTLLMTRRIPILEYDWLYNFINSMAVNNQRVLLYKQMQATFVNCAGSLWFISFFYPKDNIIIDELTGVIQVGPKLFCLIEGSDTASFISPIKIAGQDRNIIKNISETMTIHSISVLFHYFNVHALNCEDLDDFLQTTPLNCEYAKIDIEHYEAHAERWRPHMHLRGQYTKCALRSCF